MKNLFQFSYLIMYFLYKFTIIFFKNNLNHEIIILNNTCTNIFKLEVWYIFFPKKKKSQAVLVDIHVDGLDALSVLTISDCSGFGLIVGATCSLFDVPFDLLLLFYSLFYPFIFHFFSHLLHSWKWYISNC